MLKCNIEKKNVDSIWLQIFENSNVEMKCCLLLNERGKLKSKSNVKKKPKQ